MEDFSLLIMFIGKKVLPKIKIGTHTHTHTHTYVCSEYDVSYAENIIDKYTHSFLYDTWFSS